MKQHLEDTKALKRLKANFKEISDKFEDIQSRIYALESEKSTLEQLILEILSFGE